MYFYCVCDGIIWKFLAITLEFITVTTISHEMRVNCRLSMYRRCLNMATTYEPRILEKTVGSPCKVPPTLYDFQLHYSQTPFCGFAF